MHVTGAEPRTPRDVVTTALRALEKRDAAAAASTFAADGVLVDPQYPQSEYHGRETVRRAFERGLADVAERPQFAVRRFLAAAGICAVEVDTDHATRADSDGEASQVFVVDVTDEGIARWRTYHDCSPE